MRPKAFSGWLFFGAALLIMTGVELCYFLNDSSTVKRGAAFAWIIVSVGFLALVTGSSLKIFFEAPFWRSRDSSWYLTAFLLPIGLIYFDIGGVTWTPINDEGTDQIAQAMHLLQHDAGFGVYRLAYFVGYIARQYLLAALPTYFFGPSLVALRLGTSLFYVISYLAFLAGLQNYFKSRNEPKSLLLASCAGMMISLGQYPLVQARVFEQTTMPIGAMLLFLAGIFNFLAFPTPFRTFWIAWSFGYFAEGYTPALGGWLLGLFVLLYLALHPKHKYRILFAPLLYGACCLLIACLVMSSANALKLRFEVGPSHFSTCDWIWRYCTGFHYLFGADFPVIPAPLGLASLAVCFGSFKFRDYRFPLLCLWSTAMGFVSITFVGSFFNLPQFDIHRCMFILPPLAAGVVVFYHTYGSRLNPSGHRDPAILMCIRLAMLFMIYSGVGVPWTVRTYIYHRDMTDFDEALYKIDCVNWDRKAEKVAKIYIVPPLKIDDLEVGLNYFAPRATVVRGAPPPGEKAPGVYLLSYLSNNEQDRQYDPIIPSLHPRPYLELKKE